MSRTTLVAAWSESDSGGTTTHVDTTPKNIAAGALVIRWFRWEGGDAVFGFSDPIYGAYTTHKHTTAGGASVGVAYAWNHPGGTAVYGTATLDVARDYFDVGGIIRSGGDSSDPFEQWLDLDGVPLSIGYTAAVVGEAHIIHSDTALISVTATSPAVASLTWVDGKTLYRTHAAGSNTIAGSSDAGSTAATVGVVFADPGAAPPSSISETVSFTDQSSALTHTASAQAETVSFSDTSTAIFPNAGDVAETLSFTDASVSSVHYQDTRSESVSFADSQTSDAPGTITINFLRFDWYNTQRMKQAAPTPLTEFTWIRWMRVRSGSAMNTYQGGMMASLATDLFGGGINCIMSVTQGHADGTFNPTDGQRNGGVSAGPPFFYEVAGLNSGGGGIDAYASHGSYVNPGETQASYPVVFDTWVKQVTRAKIIGADVVVEDYVDWDTKHVIRQPYLASSITADAHAINIGTVPWDTEWLNADIFGVREYTTYLDDAAVDAEYSNYTNTSLQGSIHFSNVLPTLDGVYMRDLKGTGTPHDFAQNGGVLPSVGSEVFVIPAPPYSTVSETVSFSDEQTSILRQADAVSETVSFTDAQSAVNASAGGIIESVSFLDTQDSVYYPAPAVVETVSFTDVAVATANYSVAREESLYFWDYQTYAGQIFVPQISGADDLSSPKKSHVQSVSEDMRAAIESLAPGRKLAQQAIRAVEKAPHAFTVPAKAPAKGVAPASALKALRGVSEGTKAVVLEAYAIVQAAHAEKAAAQERMQEIQSLQQEMLVAARRKQDEELLLLLL